MMKDLDRFDDRVWGKLLRFLLPNETAMSPEEIEDELQLLGIDIQPGMTKVHKALQRRSDVREARAALNGAREKRSSIKARIREIISPSESLGKEALKRLIIERFTGTSQAAFFRKLDSVASNDDLKSLLDDMSKLEALAEEPDDAKS